MFLAVGLIFMFLLGLPISFGIGALIGCLIYQIYKKHSIKKAKYYVIWGGVLYILSQPISFFFVVILLEKLKIDEYVGAEPNPIGEGLTKFEMISAVLFALIFTTLILFLLAKKHISSNKKAEIEKIKSMPAAERYQPF
jgi:uncharacterized membrane protein